MKKIIAKLVLFCIGWKYQMDIPDKNILKRAVVVCAPHTSNWDFLYAILAFWGLEIPVKMFIKDSHTKAWYGSITKSLGGIGVDRGARNNLVGYAVNLFNENEVLALLNTPEASRSWAKQWKKGFFHIAQRANVPIVLAYADYKNKRAGFGKVIYIENKSIDEVFNEIEGFFSPEMAKYPELYNPKIR